MNICLHYIINYIIIIPYNFDKRDCSSACPQSYGKEVMFLKPLTAKQKSVLDYLKKEIAEKKYPPSIRDICSALGLSSTSSAHLYLKVLEEKGYIRRDPTKPRAIEVLIPKDDIVYYNKKTFNVPIVGEVTAGKPILAEENIEGYFPLPLDFFPNSEGNFMLRIKGDSMINAGMFDGDYILVRQQRDAQNGDIVVALLQDEATVKRFFRENGSIKLQPENENYDPVYIDDIIILGRVIGLFRKF